VRIAECGKLAIALFNMAVVAATSGAALVRWQPWLGLLLNTCEQLVVQADAGHVPSFNVRTYG